MAARRGPIPGASANTYVVQPRDAGERLACEVTATNSAEHKSAVSTSVRVVATMPEDTSAPKLSGSPTVGEVLSCANGTWAGGPSPTFTVQWLRDGAPISGASGSTYEVQEVDAEASLACEVTATNSAGSKSISTGVVLVAAVAPNEISGPVLSGSPVLGETLTCGEGTWEGDPAPTYAEQWLRDGAPIPDATGIPTGAGRRR